MSEVISIPGGQSKSVVAYQPATVIAGYGNDTINLFKTGVVMAGNGNDSIAIHGIGNVSVGSGHDTINLFTGGTISQTGSTGNDTINIGHGFDTIVEQGSATVYGSSTYGGYPSTFGSASISGGTLEISRTHLFDGTEVSVDKAISGTMTLMGGAAPTEFVGGTGTSVFLGGTGASTFIGGSGHDTMTGGTGSNTFEFLSAEHGGTHVITNFTSSDQLYIEGHDFAWLTSHHDYVTTHDGNTYIKIDGGTTTIELQGFTGLNSSNVTLHK